MDLSTVAMAKVDRHVTNMECGGKPVGRDTALGFQRKTKSKSAVAATLCRRTPKSRDDEGSSDLAFEEATGEEQAAAAEDEKRSRTGLGRGNNGQLAGGEKLRGVP